MKIKDGIIYREEDGLVFDTKNGKLIELNETGNEILSNIFSQSVDVDKMCDILSEKYSDTDKSEIKIMVINFINEIKEMGVLV